MGARRSAGNKAVWQLPIQGTGFRVKPGMTSKRTGCQSQPSLGETLAGMTVRNNMDDEEEK